MKNSASYLNRILSIMIIVAFSIASCAKDSDDTPDDTPDNTTQDTPQTYPTPGDADGTLVAVKSTSITDTPIGPIEVIIGTAVAVFSDDNFASGQWISAGSVSCNTHDLTLNSNNSYTFTDITQTNPMGIDFSNDVQWAVSGANGIPTFDYNADVLGFPAVGAVTSSDQIVKADGYTLTCQSVAGADSVLFLIGGAIKTLAGNATTCTFSATELQDVDTGSNIVQVAAYTMSPTDFGSTKIYFVNEAVQSKTVTVQ